MISDIQPAVDEFTPGLPLRVRDGGEDSSPFVLKPGVYRTVELISLYLNYPYGSIFSAGRKMELEVPPGTYRMLLVASANEAVAVEQWVSVELKREPKSQSLIVSFAPGSVV
jgi:hypothetical protein